MLKLDKVAKLFKALMWDKMDELYAEKHEGKPPASELTTTQGRVLLALRKEIEEAYIEWDNRDDSVLVRHSQEKLLEPSLS